MTDEKIEAIARYFTGHAVIHNSICLKLGPPHNTMARAFFDTRQALGIHGYMDKEEAVRVLLTNGR